MDVYTICHRMTCYPSQCIALQYYNIIVIIFSNNTNSRSSSMSNSNQFTSNSRLQ